MTTYYGGLYCHFPGNASKTFKVNDLNIQADDATADDDDDDGIDWEEG